MGKCLNAVNLILFSLLDIFFAFFNGCNACYNFVSKYTVMFSILLQGDNVYCKSMKYRDALPIVL